MIPRALASIATSLTASLLLACNPGFAASSGADEPTDEAAATTAAPAPGYTLFAPLRSTTTYLVDLEGKVAHQWESETPPGQSVYLLEDGSLLRTGRGGEDTGFHGGGEGGRVTRIAPDGAVVWDFVYADEHHQAHHDIEPMPNGNVLILAWERKSEEEAIAAGRDPRLITAEEMWPDHVVEIEPILPDGGKVVWEWHVWDHLVQDFDPERANWGDVAAHPELLDINVDAERKPQSEEEESEELRHLRALGYLGEEPEEEEDEPRNGRPRGMGADWNHTNSIDYHPELDRILLSVRQQSEIWIIDHSTTTEQAAGHTGGRAGRGGDLLYRWGNPANYRRGTAADRQLFVQHDARWIEPGLPGAGHVLLFNNGEPRDERAWSSIDELVLPPLRDGEHGDYLRGDDTAFGPARPTWRYAAARPADFFSSHISGAQRLSNGHTLICSGETGRVFEVTPSGETVWEYENPFVEARGAPPGGGDRRFPPRGDRRGGRRGDRRGDRGAERPARPRGDGPPGGPPDSPPADGEGAGREPQGEDGERPPFPPPGDEAGAGQRGRRGGPPGGFAGGPPDGPPGGFGPGGDGKGGSSLFRAWRYAPDDPGITALLAALEAAKTTEAGTPTEEEGR